MNDLIRRITDMVRAAPHRALGVAFQNSWSADWPPGSQPRQPVRK